MDLRGIPGGLKMKYIMTIEENDCDLPDEEEIVFKNKDEVISHLLCLLQNFTHMNPHIKRVA